MNELEFYWAFITETHGSEMRARDRNEILIRDRVVIDFEFQFENVEGEKKRVWQVRVKKRHEKRRKYTNHVSLDGLVWISCRDQ